MFWFNNHLWAWNVGERERQTDRNGPHPLESISDSSLGNHIADQGWHFTISNVAEIITDIKSLCFFKWAMCIVGWRKIETNLFLKKCRIKPLWELSQTLAKKAVQEIWMCFSIFLPLPCSYGYFLMDYMDILLFLHNGGQDSLCGAPRQSLT